MSHQFRYRLASVMTAVAVGTASVVTAQPVALAQDNNPSVTKEKDSAASLFSTVKKTSDAKKIKLNGIEKTLLKHESAVVGNKDARALHDKAREQVQKAQSVWPSEHDIEMVKDYIHDENIDEASKLNKVQALLDRFDAVEKLLDQAQNNVHDAFLIAKADSDKKDTQQAHAAQQAERKKFDIIITIVGIIGALSVTALGAWLGGGLKNIPGLPPSPRI